jgi:hypothetical protein
MPVADTLLRLAEEPALYQPRWSRPILDELERTLLRFGYSGAQAARRINAVTTAFPASMVEGFEGLIPAMTNDPKDRHVLAAAVKCGADAIVSNNVRHFPKEALAPHGLKCLTADDFLMAQYQLDREEFTRVLQQQAADIGWTLPELIARHVPSLSRLMKQ